MYDKDYYYSITQSVASDNMIAGVVLDVTNLNQWFKLTNVLPQETFLVIEENGTVTDGNGNVLTTTVVPKRKMYLVKDEYEYEIDGKMYKGVVTLMYPEDY